MSQHYYVTRVVLLALCCCAALSRASTLRPSEPESEDLKMEPSTTAASPLETTGPSTCPTTCYTGRMCQVLIAATRQAAFLRQALASELRVQSQQIGDSCNISRSTWDENSRQFLAQINGKDPRMVACRSIPEEDTFICTAYVKMLKCAVTRLQNAFESSAPCHSDWQYESWVNIFALALDFTEDLDYLYNSILLDRKVQWESIKSSLKELKELMKSTERTQMGSNVRSGGKPSKKVGLPEEDFNPRDTDAVFILSLSEDGYFDYGV